MFLSSRKYDPNSSSRIRTLIFYPFRIPGSKRSRIRNTAEKSETHLWCLALVQQRLVCRHNDAVHALVKLAHRVTSEEKMAILTLIRLAKDENDIVLFEG